MLPFSPLGPLHPRSFGLSRNFSLLRWGGGMTARRDMQQYQVRYSGPITSLFPRPKLAGSQLAINCWITAVLDSGADSLTGRANLLAVESLFADQEFTDALWAFPGARGSWTSLLDDRKDPIYLTRAAQRGNAAWLPASRLHKHFENADRSALMSGNVCLH